MPADTLPDGTKYVQVVLANQSEITRYAVLADSGIEGMTREYQGRPVRDISTDRLLPMVRQGLGVLMSVEQLAKAYDQLEPLGIRTEPFESPADAVLRRIAENESGGPYGPEMGGLRLGMGFAEAEQIIRSQMDVGWVFAMTRDEALGVRAMKPHNSGRVFVAKDGTQVYVIFDEPPAASEIVLGAWRHADIQDPNILEQDILVALTDNFGEITLSSSFLTRYWLWGESVNDAACLPRGRANIGKNLVEGPSLDSEAGRRMQQKSNSVMRNSNANVAMADPRLPPDVTPFRSCGPVISANMVRDTQNTSYLDIVLLDYGHYSRRYLESYETLRAGGNESVKAISALLGGPAKDGTEKLVSDSKVATATTLVATKAPTVEAPVAKPGDGALAAAKLPALSRPEDDRAASEFAILGLRVGMSEPEIFAVLAAEFTPEQIKTDGAGAIIGERGNCAYGDPTNAAIAAEAGSFCLAVRLVEGVAAGVSLRQVIAADVTEPALAAFQERYGAPVFLAKGVVGNGIPWSQIGWGQPVGAERKGLGRAEGPLPAAVLESSLWFGNGVSTIVLDLDKAIPAAAPSAAVKF